MFADVDNKMACIHSPVPTHLWCWQKQNDMEVPQKSGTTATNDGGMKHREHYAPERWGSSTLYPGSSLSWAANRFGKAYAAWCPLGFKPVCKQMAHTLATHLKPEQLSVLHNALARMGNNESAKSTLCWYRCVQNNAGYCRQQHYWTVFCYQWCWRRWFHHRWTEAARYGLCVDGRPP